MQQSGSWVGLIHCLSVLGAGMQVSQGAQEAIVKPEGKQQWSHNYKKQQRCLCHNHSRPGETSVSIFGLLSHYLNQSQALMSGTCPRRPAPFAIPEALQHSTTVHDERRVERLVEAYTTGSFRFVTSSRPRRQLQVSAPHDAIFFPDFLAVVQPIRFIAAWFNRGDPLAIRPGQHAHCPRRKSQAVASSHTDNALRTQRRSWFSYDQSKAWPWFPSLK